MSEHIYEDSDMEHERYHVIPFGSMREEIVRCRDCEFFRAVTDHFPAVCLLWGRSVEPDGFCWMGRPQAKLEA